MRIEDEAEITLSSRQARSMAYFLVGAIASEELLSIPDDDTAAAVEFNRAVNIVSVLLHGVTVDAYGHVVLPVKYDSQKYG